MNQEILEKAISSSCVEDVHLIHALEVEKLNQNNNGSSKQILVLTTIGASYYKISKNPSCNRTNYWVNLTGLEHDSGSMTLQFEASTMKFKSSSVPIIRKKLGDFLQRFFGPSDEAFKLVEKLTTRRFPNNPIGYLARYLSYCHSFGIEIPVNTRKFVKSMLSILKPDIEITSDNIGNTVQALFYALQDSTFPTTIRMFNTNFDPFDEFSNSFDFNSPFENAEFEHKITKGFQRLIKKLTEMEELTLKSLSFVNSEMGIDDIQTLADFIEAKSIKSISFENAMKDRALTKFYETFFNPGVMAQLLLLRLEKIPKIDLSLLLPKLSKIQVLSLQHNKLNLREVFEKLSQNPLPCLRYLDLSSNKAIEPPFPGPVFLPPQLEFLEANVIKWSDGCFLNFLQYFITRENSFPFKLNVLKAKASEAEWTAVGNFLGNCKKSSITGLGWGYNLINSQIISFFEKCSYLKSLDLSRCFTSENCILLADFCKAIQDLLHLEILTMRGDEHHNFGPVNIQNLKNLRRLPSLRTLDVTNQRIGDAGVKLIGDIARKSTSLTTICVDGSMMTTSDSFYYLLNQCAETGRKIFIDWPYEDLEQLSKTNFVKDKTIKNLKKSVNNIYNVDFDEFPDRPNDSNESTDGYEKGTNPMTKTMSVYGYRSEGRFPKYLDDNLLDLLSKKQKTLKHMNSPRHGRKSRAESDSDGEDEESHSKKRRKSTFVSTDVSNKKTRKRSVSNAQSSESDDESVGERRRKKNYSLKRKPSRIDSDSDEDTSLKIKKRRPSRRVSSDDDDDSMMVNKRGRHSRSKSSVYGDDSMSMKQSPRKRSRKNSSDDEDDSSRKSSRKLKKSRTLNTYNSTLSITLDGVVDEEILDNLRNKFSFKRLGHDLANDS